MYFGQSTKIFATILLSLVTGCGPSNDTLRKEIERRGGTFEVEGGTIGMEGSDIDDNDIKILQQVRGIRHLSLQHSKVTDEGAAILADMTDLEMINLRDTEVGDATAIIIARLPEMRVVNLSGTRVTDTGIKAFESKTLHYLGLADTDVSEKAIQSLKNVRERATPGGDILKK